MNNYTAQNGLKTFVLTLGISLMFFGVIYMLLNSGATKSVADIDSEVKNTEVSANVLGDTDSQPSDTAEMVATQPVPQPTTDTSSVFGTIAKNKPTVAVRAVLAGATEATQSTVPQTGTSEMTAAFMFAVTVLSLGLFMIVRGPRRTALSSFERDVTRTLR